MNTSSMVNHLILTTLFLLGSAPPILGQVLEVGTQTLSFGVLDGQETEVIGRVEDLAVGPSGDIFLTDALQMRIGWIRADGSRVHWFGREGDGPEEFRWLGSIQVAPDGRVVAADVAHHRFVFLSLSDEGLHLDDVVQTPLTVRDFCFLQGRMFVLSYHDGRVVHEVDQDGAVLRSFGKPLKTPFEYGERFARFVDSYSGDGKILCLPESELVVVLPHILPEIRAFRVDGSTAWTHVLSPYARTTMKETSRGTMQMGWDPETSTVHESVSLWAHNEHVLAVQLVEATPPGGPDEGVVEVRFLDVRSGELLSFQRDVPRVAAMWQNQIVAWETLPYPRVVRYEGGVR